jgi:hypothetical protein
LENIIQGVGSEAGEGAFPPTPVDLAQLKEKLEKALNNGIKRDVYYDSISLSFAIEDIARETVRRFFNLNYLATIEVMHLYDEEPQYNAMIEAAEVAGEVESLTLRDLESRDIVELKFTLNDKETIIEIYLEYEARELNVKHIHMLKLLTPIAVRDIQIEVRK